MSLSDKILKIGTLALIISACSPTLKTGGSGDYHEDLSLLRPIYTIPDSNDDPEVELIQNEIGVVETGEFHPEFDITQKLDSLLDTVAVNNQQIKYVQGYTIQVYTGNSQEEANEAKAKVYQSLPGSRPQVSYDLPNYKVKVGKYYYRLQAQKEFATIKKVFQTAILVPQQFRID